MPEPRFAIGLDFGTSSARALVVDTSDGREVGAGVADYPSGDRGVVASDTDPNLARQHPADYALALARCVRAAISAARRDPGFDPSRVAGLGVDTTGSTPLPVDDACRPIALDPAFAGDPAAMAWLWKDHTAHAEAAEITGRIRDAGLPYLSACGGVYSSEWYWSKILLCERAHPRVAGAAAAWLELCDYVPALLAGVASPMLAARGLCAAGHKAMYHEGWGGLPAASFLDSLHPRLSRHRATYRAPALTADRRAGGLSAAWAAELGLPAGLPIAAGALDAHLGALGAGCGPGTLVKIIGTSSCDCMVAAPSQRPASLPGVCGVVPGSIVPGLVGIEAGQPAVGDLFDWFVTRLSPAGAAADRHEQLSAAAARLRPGESGLVALDWNNGNRSVLADQRLTGLLVGQTLATTPAEVYLALIEATAFGALAIIESIEGAGVRVDRIVACGGVAERSDLVRRVYADVLDRPVYKAKSASAPALGAAMCGAVAGGAHRTIGDAAAAMTGLGDRAHRPDPERAEVYRRLGRTYRALHDAFGRGAGPVGGVMKELISIRDLARSGATTGR